MHLYVEVLVNSRQSLRPLNELNNVAEIQICTFSSLVWSLSFKEFWGTARRHPGVQVQGAFPVKNYLADCLRAIVLQTWLCWLWPVLMLIPCCLPAPQDKCVSMHSRRAGGLVVYLWTDDRGGQRQEGSRLECWSSASNTHRQSQHRAEDESRPNPGLTPDRSGVAPVAGCPEVEVSLLCNHSLRFRVESLYIWQQGSKKVATLGLQLEPLLIHCDGSAKQRERRVRWCVCVCVSHTQAESHFPVTPLYLAARLDVIAGFEFLF